jgi:hypothetical protein
MAWNWGSAAGGAGMGASMGGPWGALAGGVLGGLFGGGKKAKTKKLPTMTPQQLSLLNQMTDMLGPEGQLGKGYAGALGLQQELMDPSSAAVQRFADPYMQQFEQQTVPGLAERFAGAGAMGGGLSSSGFGQALSAAGGNLQTQLAALKAGLGQQAAGQLMQQFGGMAGQVMGQRPFGYTYEPGGTGLLGQMASGWAAGGFPGLPWG